MVPESADLRIGDMCHPAVHATIMPRRGEARSPTIQFPWDADYLAVLVYGCIDTTVVHVARGVHKAPIDRRSPAFRFKFVNSLAGSHVGDAAVFYVEPSHRSRFVADR
jgi:hypothetical protein